MEPRVFVMFIDNMNKLVTNGRYTVSEFKEVVKLPRVGSNELLIVRTLAMTVTICHDQMTVTGTQSKHSQECIDYLNSLMEVRTVHLREIGYLL